MSNERSLVPIERIEGTILFIREQKVMLDADLADLYGVSTKVLNQAVKRNKERFPDEFMFQLTKHEKKEVVTNCDHLKKLRFSHVLPFAFTEHGAVMLATVLNSTIAVQTSIQVVKAFIKLRGILATQKDLARKIEDMERKYDGQFRVVFDAIRELMRPPEHSKKKIGFLRE
ncbi:MAG: ORF6N domain-containing protein [Nitrospirota bacterium]